MIEIFFPQQTVFIYLLCTRACDILFADFGSLASNMTRARPMSRDKVTEAVEVKVTQMEQNEEEEEDSGRREHLVETKLFFI